jgi:hypothetical protein
MTTTTENLRRPLRRSDKGGISLDERVYGVRLSIAGSRDRIYHVRAHSGGAASKSAVAHQEMLYPHERVVEVITRTWRITEWPIGQHVIEIKEDDVAEVERHIKAEDQAYEEMKNQPGYLYHRRYWKILEELEKTA